jgi:hypothetical protein
MERAKTETIIPYMIHTNSKRFFQQLSVWIPFTRSDKKRLMEIVVAAAAAAAKDQKTGDKDQRERQIQTS